MSQTTILRDFLSLENSIISSQLNLRVICWTAREGVREEKRALRYWSIVLTDTFSTVLYRSNKMVVNICLKTTGIVCTDCRWSGLTVSVNFLYVNFAFQKRYLSLYWSVRPSIFSMFFLSFIIQAQDSTSFSVYN